MKIPILLAIIIFVSACDINSNRVDGGCTKEAKMCSDGSGVSRNPARNCEFDPCPTTSNDDLDEDNIDDYIVCSEEIGSFCVQIYDPVCGEDEVTYSNSCMACQKVSKYKHGEC